MGRRPVCAITFDIPPGVMRDTLLEPSLVVYTLPDGSSAMPMGRREVRPRIVEAPAGVIFETFREFQLAV